ncbi:MAG: hypothetical protein P4M11_10330 [Candidatus Pacebacteria bacterium]|nr:hypothetical protein [Candidatus Paceibacterota bacterium]
MDAGSPAEGTLQPNLSKSSVVIKGDFALGTFYKSLIGLIHEKFGEMPLLVAHINRDHWVRSVP